MTWTLIKQDNALNNLDLLQKMRVDLTVDNNFFNEIKFDDLYAGKEWVIESDGFYLNIAAAVNQNPFDGSSLSVGSEIKEFYACYITDNYDPMKNFEDRLTDDLPNVLKSGAVFFDGAVNNYYIYKHNTLNSFFFVFEWSSGLYSFMFFGDYLLATQQGNQTSKCFATNADFRISDNELNALDNFRPLFGSDCYLLLYYDNKFVPRFTSGYNTKKWSENWCNLKSNLIFNATLSNPPPNFGSRSTDPDNSIFAISKTKFNDKHIPLPIYFYIRNRGLAEIDIETLLGTIPDLNSICFDTITAGEELSYGDRTAQCFPNYQKTIPSDWENKISEVSGIAIRTL